MDKPKPVSALAHTLGGEKGFGSPCQGLRIHALTDISHFQNHPVFVLQACHGHLFVKGSARADGDVAPFWHRIACVKYQIQQQGF
ncbi:MAG: hypothetical protein ACJARL_002107, partial [Halopseudomonas sp.]